MFTGCHAPRTRFIVAENYGSLPNARPATVFFIDHRLVHSPGNYTQKKVPNFFLKCNEYERRTAQKKCN
jgi:hypothetical protein